MLRCCKCVPLTPFSVISAQFSQCLLRTSRSMGTAREWPPRGPLLGGQINAGTADAGQWPGVLVPYGTRATSISMPPLPKTAPVNSLWLCFSGVEDALDIAHHADLLVLGRPRDPIRASSPPCPAALPPPPPYLPEYNPHRPCYSTTGTSGRIATAARRIASTGTLSDCNSILA